MDANEIAALKDCLPESFTVATGSGTKRSFAQIISPYRRNSWFALAQDEPSALRRALAQYRADRHKSA